MKTIKDPLHGYIDIPEEELSILNTPEFQRLRRINQLGLSETVYPSATHTRFSHSLGVMYLAGELSKSLNLSDEEIKINKIAGLVHDLGHLPFSHTLESLLIERANKTHEDISCEYIDKFKKDYKLDISVDTNKVKSLIRGNHPIVNTVANDIDADRLDYLVRDSYNTGINFGKIESESLIKFITLINGKIGFDYKALKSVERLLDARMQMNYSVYQHNTVEITETMLKRAVELYLDSSEMTIESLIGLDDYELSYILSNADNYMVKKLFNNIQNRNLYKTAFISDLHNNSYEEMNLIQEYFDEPHIHEKNIADIAGISKNKVFLNAPTISNKKSIEIPIKKSSNEIYMLEDISPKPKALRKSSLIHENFHVFAPENCVNKVNDATINYIKTIDELDDLIIN